MTDIRGTDVVMSLKSLAVQTEESGKGFDCVNMVGGRCRLAARVHSPERRAHIDTAQRYLRCQDIAERRAACHIAVIDKALAGYSCNLADAPESGCAIGVGHVLAVGVDLDTRSSAQYGMIRRVELLRIVRMQTVGVVGRNHE